MSKNKDQKRKEQLALRAKHEAFRFQVEFVRKQKGIDITGMEQALATEVDLICQNGLADDMQTLAKVVEGIRQELGYGQEADRCSLNGALVPYIFGITSVCPDGSSYVPSIFTAKMPLRVVVAYDNEIRNRVVDWVKAHYDRVTTLLGSPVLRLQNMIVEFKRVVKE